VLLAGTGLTYAEISALVAASYAATLLFEIPTGVFADVHGRKLSVLLGVGANAATSIGIFLWFDNFPLLLVMFVLQGIGTTFMSGAFGAWLTDSLLCTVKAEELSEYWGQLASRGQMGALRYIPEAKAEKPASDNSASMPTAYWRILATGSLALLRKADLRRLTMASFIWFVGTGILSLA